jgi:hypothetical protein
MSLINTKSTEKVIVKKFTEPSQFREWKAIAKRVGIRDGWWRVMTIKDVWDRLPMTDQEKQTIHDIIEKVELNDDSNKPTLEDKKKVSVYMKDAQALTWLMNYTGENTEMRRITMSNETAWQAWQELEKRYGSTALSTDYTTWEDKFRACSYHKHHGDIGMWLDELQYINSKLKEIKQDYGQDEFQLCQVILKSLPIQYKTLIGICNVQPTLSNLTVATLKDDILRWRANNHRDFLHEASASNPRLNSRYSTVQNIRNLRTSQNVAMMATGQQRNFRPRYTRMVKGICKNCGRQGHRADTCTAPRRGDVTANYAAPPRHTPPTGRALLGHRQNNAANIRCYNCNQVGHYQRDCPQPPRPEPGSRAHPHRAQSSYFIGYGDIIEDNTQEIHKHEYDLLEEHNYDDTSTVDGQTPFYDTEQKINHRTMADLPAITTQQPRCLAPITLADMIDNNKREVSHQLESRDSTYNANRATFTYSDPTTSLPARPSEESFPPDEKRTSQHHHRCARAASDGQHNGAAPWFDAHWHDHAHFGLHQRRSGQSVHLQPKASGSAKEKALQQEGDLQNAGQHSGAPHTPLHAGGTHTCSTHGMPHGPFCPWWLSPLPPGPSGQHKALYLRFQSLINALCYPRYLLVHLGIVELGVQALQSLQYALQAWPWWTPHHQTKQQTAPKLTHPTTTHHPSQGETGYSYLCYQTYLKAKTTNKKGSVLTKLAHGQKHNFVALTCLTTLAMLWKMSSKLIKQKLDEGHHSQIVNEDDQDVNADDRIPIQDPPQDVFCLPTNTVSNTGQNNTLHYQAYNLQQMTDWSQLVTYESLRGTRHTPYMVRECPCTHSGSETPEPSQPHADTTRVSTTSVSAAANATRAPHQTCTTTQSLSTFQTRTLQAHVRYPKLKFL